MPSTLAFDVYGTLVDTAGIAARLRERVADDAAVFAARWREKQLEYAFRRALMRDYRTFEDCTREALDYCCESLNHPLPSADRDALMEAYAQLPPFADARPALQGLQAQGHVLYAFSNGTEAAVRRVLGLSGLLPYFRDVVSVDAVRSFKPDPAVYAHLRRRTGDPGDDLWMVSSNPFDVLGALAAGLRSVWVCRTQNAVFDPWGKEPTLRVDHLEMLARDLPT
jgi:2-haloacid dehalogenase